MKFIKDIALSFFSFLSFFFRYEKFDGIFFGKDRFDCFKKGRIKHDIGEEIERIGLHRCNGTRFNPPLFTDREAGEQSSKVGSI